MRNLRIKTFALLLTVVTVLAAASVYAYYQTVPGIVQVYVTDPPAYSSDVQHIYVTFYKVELHRVQGDAWMQVGGNFFQTIDLMAASNSSLLLTSQQLPQGGYNMIRITLSYVRVVLMENNATENLWLPVPSNLQNGLSLSLNRQITVKAGSIGSVLLNMSLDDHDLHESVMTPEIEASTPN